MDNGSLNMQENTSFFSWESLGAIREALQLEQKQIEA